MVVILVVGGGNGFVGYRCVCVCVFVCMCVCVNEY